LLAWIYESRFANFNQGLSSEQKLQNPTDAGSVCTSRQFWVRMKSPDMSGLSFLESVPAISAKLKEPVTADRKFEEVVKSAQDAAVLVLVY